MSGSAATGARSVVGADRGDGAFDLGRDEGAQLARAALALARRLAAGASLWCLALEWPEHGRHLAVEFVHPVVVGKRAFPAISVTGSDAVGELRAAVRPGDALAVIAPAESGIALDAVRRAPAWGVDSWWIGAGVRPPRVAVDHLVWVHRADGTDDDDGGGGAGARHDGSLVLRYHVLWELTHVCCEHPGLLTESASCDDEAGTCITCGDDGHVGEVRAAAVDGLAAVRTARGTETVDTTLVGDVAPGDLVLVHAGTAIERIAASRG